MHVHSKEDHKPFIYGHCDEALQEASIVPTSFEVYWFKESALHWRAELHCTDQAQIVSVDSFP